MATAWLHEKWPRFTFLSGKVVHPDHFPFVCVSAVAEAAAKVGFKVELVSFEGMDIFEQIKTTSRFDFFVGVHGKIPRAPKHCLHYSGRILSTSGGHELPPLNTSLDSFPLSSSGVVLSRESLMTCSEARLRLALILRQVQSLPAVRCDLTVM